ncbi:MAG: cell wall metabolism sensor histidine kinase WalK [Chloroflexota bacterium]|nr:cell wall metabolism sensor histidine kinase WalK [Chloroflexota bacterium]
MPAEILVLIAVGVVAAVVLTASLTRRRVRDTVRRELGGAPGEDLGRATRDLRTEAAAARADAARAREDLGQIGDLLETGVVHIDADRRVTSANRAAYRLLGQRPGSLMGRSAMEAFVDHRMEDLVRSAAQTGVTSSELATLDGSDRIVMVRARPATTGGIWLVLEDVTELRRLQRIRTEFIDNLSHELRTPLTTVRLLTETVTRDLEDVSVPSRIRERIMKIDVETGHLVQMVNELLDLSRIEGGAPQLLHDEVELAGVIRAAIERIRPFADRQRVRLVADLPGKGPLARVVGDEERLGQLLINLLHNAVKFSHDGMSVVVAGREVAGEVLVTVADQGAGIPRGDLDRVFERFYKVDKARVRGVGGTGLGLAIARHIVEAHDGRIWVESEEGRGSAFSFAIPVAPGG